MTSAVSGATISEKTSFKQSVSYKDFTECNLFRRIWHCELNRALKAKFSIRWYFFHLGAIVGNWSALIPTILRLRSIDDAILGGILVASIAGAIIAAPTVTWFIARFGSGISTSFGSTVLASVSIIIGIPGPIWILVVALTLLGFGMGWTDVSANSQALLCEKAIGKSMLGSFHASYALGGLFGVLYGGALVQSEVPILNILILLALIMILPALLLKFGLFSLEEETAICKSVESVDDDRGKTDSEAINDVNMKLELSQASMNITNCTCESYLEAGLISISGHDDSKEDGETESEKNFTQHYGTEMDLSACQPHHRRASSIGSASECDLRGTSSIGFIPLPILKKDPQISIDYKMLLILCCLGGLAYAGEGSIGDWSTVYLVIDLSSPPLVGVLGFAVFQVITAIVRYSSDSVVEHIDRKLLLQVAGCLAGVGLGIAVLAPSLPSVARIPVAILGFGVCGAGLSVVSPIVIFYAGTGINGLDSSQAIAIVSSASYLGVLVGPPLFGGLAVGLGGLRWSLLVDGCVMMFIFVLGRLIPTK